MGPAIANELLPTVERRITAGHEEDRRLKNNLLIAYMAAGRRQLIDFWSEMAASVNKQLSVVRHSKPLQMLSVVVQQYKRSLYGSRPVN